MKSDLFVWYLMYLYDLLDFLQLCFALLGHLYGCWTVNWKLLSQKPSTSIYLLHSLAQVTQSLMQGATEFIDDANKVAGSHTTL